MAIPFHSSQPVATPATAGVILAIDYGKKRLGLALSDEHGVTANPFATWTRINRRRDLARLRDLVRQQNVRRIVVGLPLHLDGTPSEISDEAKRFAVRVAKALGIPVEMMDERLSSWEAKQAISAMESHPRARRGSEGRAKGNRRVPLDDVAAAIILRDYLDRSLHPSGLRDAVLKDAPRVTLSSTKSRDTDSEAPHREIPGCENLGCRTKMRRLLLFLFLLLILGAGYAYLALYRPYQGFPSGGVYVDIPHGASQRTIARLLDDNGVVRSRFVFEALCRSRQGSTLEAGEYFFDHPVTAFEVYDAIANGRVYVKEFVVPEGFTMFDIADLAAGEGFLSRDEFLAAARDTSAIRDIAPDAPTLEGFLFPATYEFPRHMTGKDMTGAMVKKFRQEWLTLPSESALPGRSLQNVVTLASLVERETPQPEERPHVAGVFENRLRIGQPLQCDPTVAYALTLAGEYSGKLSGGDLRFASPYNTYMNKGLPPGPIANPGEAALRAALDPPPTEDLYFVANTEGGHFFSRTLQEHNQNVARYRRLLEQSQNPPASNASPSAPTANKSRPARLQ